MNKDFEMYLSKQVIHLGGYTNKLYIRSSLREAVQISSRKHISSKTNSKVLFMHFISISNDLWMWTVI